MGTEALPGPRARLALRRRRHRHPRRGLPRHHRGLPLQDRPDRGRALRQRPALHQQRRGPAPPDGHQEQPEDRYCSATSGSRSSCPTWADSPPSFWPRRSGPPASTPRPCRFPTPRPSRWRAPTCPGKECVPSHLVLGSRPPVLLLGEVPQGRDLPPLRAHHHRALPHRPVLRLLREPLQGHAARERRGGHP